MTRFDTEPHRRKLEHRMGEIEDSTEGRLAAAATFVPEEFRPFWRGAHGETGRQLALPAVSEARRQAQATIHQECSDQRLAALDAFCKEMEETLVEGIIQSLARGAEGADALHRYLDEVTPHFLYGKMEKLPPQQQKILLAFADQWPEPLAINLSIPQVAKITDLPDSTVSGQLRRLEERGYLTSEAATNEPSARKSYTVKSVAFHAWMVWRYVQRASRRERSLNLLSEHARRSQGSGESS